ncbi:hypothetical protein [Polaromonas sp.]|uniref:hypothetical protein n=1 Tax=Polaromonas sp. TaxID=1869339 RepID=UPI0025E130CD|nr:hypothetical protein [Polaromonas sp.]
MKSSPDLSEDFSLGRAFYLGIDQRQRLAPLVDSHSLCEVPFAGFVLAEHAEWKDLEPNSNRLWK